MSSMSPTKRQLKTPLHHLKSKKWCFPPSPQLQSSSNSCSSTPSVSKSPEPNCAICLGKIEDKSFTDRCFHCFCRTCLFEWSKVKAECPVCRQAFDKIIFNIRAMDDYDEEVIETSHRPRYGLHSSPFMTYSNIDGITRFRYPTTLTPLRRRMMDFERRLQMQIQMTDYSYARTFPENFLDFLETHRRGRNGSNHTNSVNTNTIRSNLTNTVPSIGLVERHSNRRDDPLLTGPQVVRSNYNPGFYGHHHYDLDIFPPPAGTSAHRRYVYDSDLWVMTNGDGNQLRTREASARFFSSNPACTHRLIPWLNRELNSILTNPNETENLIPRIMNALLMYDITSSGFKKLIAPYTLSKTNHFIHEFYNFARSPYDIEQYTRISIYVPRHRAQIVESESLPTQIGYRMEPDSPSRSSLDSISSSDSSIEILNDSPELQIPILTPQSPGIFSIDGTNTDVSSTEIRQLITPSPIVTPSLQEGLQIQSEITVNNNSESVATNRTPIPRGDLPDVNFGNINIIEDFDNPKPGTSGIRLRTTAQTKWSDSETTDIDVGDELEAAIARFEKREIKSEVKKEIKTEVNNIEPNLNADNDSDCSSVLIVGYVKPLHERTPELVDLISDKEEEEVMLNNNESKRMKKSKKEKKDKHRKRSKCGSGSPHMHSHNRKKCKHKSRDRSKDHYKDKYKHKMYRYSKHSRSKSSSSSSSSSNSSDDEFKRMSDGFKRKKHYYNKHRKHYHSRHDFNHDLNRFDINNSSNSLERKPSVCTTTTSMTSSSRPSSLGSVVIRKQPVETETIKIKHYYIYSDTD